MGRRSGTLYNEDMKRDNFIKGRQGESEAVRFLEKKGYEIVERNFATRFGEIDVICKKGELLVFVEVKAKTGDDFGEPWEMINKRKMIQVKRVAKFWLVREKLGEVASRIDVIGVWLDSGEIKHWENVEGEWG